MSNLATLIAAAAKSHPHNEFGTLESSQPLGDAAGHAARLALHLQGMGLGRGTRWALVGRTGNRDAIGARVRVVAGGRTAVAQVHAGRGYQGHHGTRLHFGLGPAHEVERIEVRWPGGGEDRHEGLRADRVILLRESRAPL